jgi:hypothetical protein
MLKNFTKYAGVVQTLIGLASQIWPGFAQMLGSPATANTSLLGSGNLFNMLSGVALSYLGFGGSQNVQRTGAQVVGGLNGLVGILGAIGVKEIAGLQLSSGWGTIVVNLLVAAWGLYSGFVKKPTGATAH